jgi:CHAD domain-containing protein
MKWRPTHSASVNARAVLPSLAEKYFEAGRKAADHKRSPRSLHRFRIETKRFRYSLEVFQPIYGPTLDRYLKALHGIQDALGKVSDCQTVIEMLKGDRAMEQKLERSLKKSSRDFRREWRQFDSEGQLEKWKGYLGRGPARSSARRAARPKRAA